MCKLQNSKVHRYFSCTYVYIVYNHRPISFIHTSTTNISILHANTLSVICGGKSTTLSWLTVAVKIHIQQYTVEERCETFSNIYTNYPHGEMVRLMRALPSHIPSILLHRRKIRKSDALSFPCFLYV